MTYCLEICVIGSYKPCIINIANSSIFFERVFFDLIFNLGKSLVHIVYVRLKFVTVSAKSKTPIKVMSLNWVEKVSDLLTR